MVRPLGAVAVVLAGFGRSRRRVGWLGCCPVPQYPYLLGTHVDLHAGTAPHATMAALGVVTVLAVVLVVPSLTWLLWLTHRGTLTDTGQDVGTS